MNKLDNYKYLCFKKLYNDLNLNEIEDTLISSDIMSLEIQKDEDYDVISRYFFLLNDVNINGLNEEELVRFNNLFSKKAKDLSDKELKESFDFIEHTYEKILFPEIDSKYVYYGPISDNFICPTDAIAIGLYYDVFSKEEDFEVENKLADIVNYIQFDLAKKVNKKVAVLKFNQLTLAEKQNDFHK